MTTSGVTTQSLTGLDIVTSALGVLGGLQLGANASGSQARQALTHLNLMVKGWATKPHLWLTEEGTLTLVASTASYALPADVRKVMAMRRHITGNDLPMTEWSREEYYDFPTKTSAGSPLNFYQDRQLSAVTVHVWPVPNAAIVATTTLIYTYARQIEVFTLTSTADVPEEWQEALIYNLAARMLPMYPQDGPTTAMIRETAATTFAALTSNDQESTSLCFQPASQYSR